MAAAMNGIALHGGFIPYGGTFLVFCRLRRGRDPAGGLMDMRVIYVLTHDSIGLGEDGPTHQPVEHLATLRAIPNLNVFRPADAVETAECWEMALLHADTPTALALSRQSAADPAHEAGGRKPGPRGAPMCCARPTAPRDVTLVATGSEVGDRLRRAPTASPRDGIRAAVVSMPCWELFEAQARPIARGARRRAAHRASRRRCGSAGTAGSARAALRRHDGLRRLRARPDLYRVSASPRRPSPRRPARAWRSRLPRRRLKSVRARGGSSHERQGQDRHAARIATSPA